jgi:hypothetical protein
MPGPQPKRVSTLVIVAPQWWQKWCQTALVRATPSDAYVPALLPLQASFFAPPASHSSILSMDRLSIAR